MSKIGVAFPFVSDGKGSIEYSNSLEKSIEDSIKQIILTKKGERPMLPEFGCDVWKLTFDYDINIIQELASEYIKDAITKWETRIEIHSVNTSKSEDSVYAEVLYKIKNSNMNVLVSEIYVNIGGI